MSGIRSLYFGGGVYYRLIAMIPRGCACACEIARMFDSEVCGRLQLMDDHSSLHTRDA
jgi:hypothetical protein